MIELFNMVKIKQLSAEDLRVSTALKENQSYILQPTLGSLYQSRSRVSYTYSTTPALPYLYPHIVM